MQPHGEDALGQDPGGGRVNPRLSDVFGLVVRQDEVDFVVPHLREDLPLYLDPFLLWASSRDDYQELHESLLGFIEQVRAYAVNGQALQAKKLLAEVREPNELGLGYASGSKQGSALGPATISAIVELFPRIPQLEIAGLNHVEILALLVPKLAEDRISDLTANVIKRWLAEFSTARATQLGIPTRKYRLTGWDAAALAWRSLEAHLPYNPMDDSPILLVPLDLLRRLPWINYGDYYRTTYAPLVLPPSRTGSVVSKADVLAYNRANYEVVKGYVAVREAQASACTPDPLFTPLKLDTIKKKLAKLRALPTGRINGADKQYEELAFEILASLLYPELDLAGSQERTESGAHIRDAIFHNDGKTPFLSDLRDQYGARQVVIEFKNVEVLSTEHVNQLWRYLDNEEMGKFGVLLTRMPPPRNVARNIIDLHSSKRAVVLCLDDSDLALMFSLFDSGRPPVEALRKKHVKFARSLPK